MSDRIEIGPAEGLWVVRAGGAVLGESRNALELRETGHAPVIYFPRADLAMAFLEPSPTRTSCPYKGEASYFSIQTKSTLIEDAAWTYESPKQAAAEVAGHVAFYGSKATIEKI